MKINETTKRFNLLKKGDRFSLPDDPDGATLEKVSDTHYKVIGKKHGASGVKLKISSKNTEVFPPGINEEIKSSEMAPNKKKYLDTFAKIINKEKGKVHGNPSWADAVYYFNKKIPASKAAKSWLKANKKLSEGISRNDLKDLIKEMLFEGEYGPGTKVNAKLKTKEWKAEIGAIENKKRPEALYITMSTWVKPKLSVLKAKANLTDDPEALAISTIMDFKKDIDMIKRKIGSMFDDKLFDTSSVIFTYDIAAGQAKVGKRQFIELEINIDTVNDIDYDGNAAPNKENGAINSIPFKDFVKPCEMAIEKILKLDALNPKKSSVDFAKVKGAK